MSTPELVRSRYFVMSTRTYADEHGRSVRLGYATRTGRIVHMSGEDGFHLERGDVGRVTAGTLQSLTEAEAVVQADESELAEVLLRMQRTSDDPAVRRFTIMPTAYCNMTCSYCGQEHRKGSVQSDLVEKTIARVTSAFAAPSSKRVHVVWFGGEPLLGLRVLREMSSAFLWASQRYGKSYGASVVTNGSLLSDRTLQTLVEECHVRSIEVTLDGPAAIHDSRRTKRNGTGSFRKIVRLLSSTVREAKWPSLRLGIRVNIDRENEAHVSELIADLACYGFGHPRVELHLAPVHSWGNDVSAVEMEAKMYSQRECEWLRQAHDLGIDAVLLPTVPVQTTCLATSTFGELIDPGGGVYSCSEHPLVPRDKDKGLIATLDSLGSTARRPPGQFDGWYGEVRSGSWPCAQCPFLPVCGGSCPKQWHEGGLPCPSFKFGWESRLDIAAERMGLTVDA